MTRTFGRPWEAAAPAVGRPGEGPRPAAARRAVARTEEETSRRRRLRGGVTRLGLRLLSLLMTPLISRTRPGLRSIGQEIIRKLARAAGERRSAPAKDAAGDACSRHASRRGRGMARS